MGSAAEPQVLAASTWDRSAEHHLFGHAAGANVLVRSSTRQGSFYFVFAMLVFTQISRNDHRMENAKIKLIINGSAGARSVMNVLKVWHCRRF